MSAINNIAFVLSCLCSVILLSVLSSTVGMENHEGLDHPVTVEYWDRYGTFSIEYSEEDVISYPDGFYRTIPGSNFHRFVTLDDPAVNKLYAVLSERMIGMSEWKKADYLCSFVYYNISYKYDAENHGCEEYLQYASETLLTLKGDCEDHSILLYNLYRLSGIDAKMAMTTDHAFLVIEIEDVEVRVDPTNYYYIGAAYVDGMYVYFDPKGSVILMLIIFATMTAAQFTLVGIFRD